MEGRWKFEGGGVERGGSDGKGMEDWKGEGEVGRGGRKGKGAFRQIKFATTPLVVSPKEKVHQAFFSRVLSLTKQGYVPTS